MWSIFVCAALALSAEDATPTGDAAPETEVEIEAAAAPGGAVIGYYDLTKGHAPSRIPWKYLTQLNLAFAGIDSTGTCNWVHDIYEAGAYRAYTLAEAAAVEAIIDKLKAARAASNPAVRINLGIGGAGLSYGFSRATSTFDGAWHVAWSCAALVKRLGLDGIDYDWEYPTHYPQQAWGCPYSSCAASADAANLTALLRNTRYYLPRPAIVSVAVNHQVQNFVLPYEAAKMDPLVDFWNVMTYEMAGSWSGGAQLASPLDQSAQSMRTWAGTSGVTRSKVVLGVPFYSKYWQVGADRGLGSPGTCNDQGVAFTWVGPRCAGQESGWSCYVVKVSQGAYCYCKSHGVWYAYDGPEQMRAKAAYARQNGLGGVMFWSLPLGDDGAFNLTRALWSGLRGAQVELTPPPPTPAR
jgi:chitinase